MGELVAKVAVALSEVGLDQESGRVTEVPTARTVRYYTTLGIVAPPAAFKGRTALYDERHLLQLVAVKRLQAEGASLEAVQARLVGSSGAELAALAKLPHAGGSRSRGGGRRDAALWAEPPVEAVERPGPEASGHPVEAMTGVKLHPRVRLWIEGGASRLERADVEAILAASEPLLAVLRLRGLLTPERDPDA